MSIVHGHRAVNNENGTVRRGVYNRLSRFLNGGRDMSWWHGLFRKSDGTEATSVPADANTSYRNPIFGWSIRYPTQWCIDSMDPGFVRVVPTDVKALCGVHSSRLRCATLNEFTDFALDHNEKFLKQNGQSFTVLERCRLTLAGGEVADHVLADIGPGGRSRRLYVLTGGLGFTVDCETHLANWLSVEASFDEIIRSFTPGSQNAGTAVDTQAAYADAIAQVNKLFERCVPEVAGGAIRIMRVVRDGLWSKVGVEAGHAQADLDPANSGIRGIVDALGGPELARVDIIRWDESLQVLIRRALLPAQIEAAYFYRLLGRAVVLVSPDQLPQAVGDDTNRNVRLASQLLGWDIELVTQEELKSLLERAVNSFQRVPDITQAQIEALIDEGLFSYEDVAALNPAQLASVLGSTEKQAAVIIHFAREASPAK